MDEEAEADDDDELPELKDLIQSSLPCSSPPKKRQRTTTQNPLYKPFKIPLKTTTSNAASSSRNSSATPSAKSTERPRSEPNLPRNTPHLTHKTLSSPTKPSPHLDQLQKKHTALLNELSSLRENLETTNQALAIESSTDTELEGLIRKWRFATNDAAEEVFGIMKERVDGMGGYKIWRAKENDAGCKDERDSDEDEGFTMETMLKSLGIPLEKIGYDRESQRWMD
ncbi:MAG: hypothetical protein L6R37_005602 [Teloschistes peruensis]|nr:MAG: hypothetical protein L6R37_005602 [Teloschistes peruensis]